MVADARDARAIGGDPSRFFREAVESFPHLRRWIVGEPRNVLTAGPLTWRTRRQSVAGCLLLGDAAGFYDPFTGQGVTFALLTAALAVEVASAALEEDDCSEARLAEYSSRRRAMLDPRVRVQKAIQAVVERPWLLERVLHRLDRSPEAARTLVGVVADVLPATRLLSPGFFLKLFV
jgi:flavin-dependent dehydrogenase